MPETHVEPTSMATTDMRYEGGTHGTTGHDEPDLILTDDQALIAASNTGDNVNRD